MWQREVGFRRPVEARHDSVVLLQFVVVVVVSGCHVKVHKDHLDRKEEFIGYCKGERMHQLAAPPPPLTHCLCSDNWIVIWVINKCHFPTV